MSLRRSKGLTEQGIASLGYDDVIIFRPGPLLEAGRKDGRMVEGIFMYVTTALFTVRI